MRTESFPSLHAAFERLVTIMDELREQCPWDRKQTMDSLRPMTIEETYELADAILQQNSGHVREELGDLLLHILFYARIGREQDQFTLEEVITGIADKLVTRHPHIYGDVQVKDEDDVKRNWEKLKMKEGKTSVLSGVPRGLPSLVKAIRIQEKARQVGFEWDHKEQVFEKIQEELAELQEAVAAAAPEKMEEELGDVLFSLINYARFLQVDADRSLERTNQKFMQRFQAMEAKALEAGRSLNEMTLVEMDAIWNHIKQQQSESQA
ncbi:MAG TPA: nucleoside triphosphate pyrophosphohydrolase [Lacibacter sp.]|nr:nucleoside triphosphate pyrophosphohydrolase [Lacibacter sp.]HMO89099.1 nucleoside triphosphate pyrophosphohydrolase [Lacibacter sp.]HMP85806.1 nucleoside triphosphate pyrophosphohydrolase [Lacibacter sp.]